MYVNVYACMQRISRLGRTEQVCKRVCFTYVWGLGKWDVYLVLGIWKRPVRVPSKSWGSMGLEDLMQFLLRLLVRAGATKRSYLDLQSTQNNGLQTLNSGMKPSILGTAEVRVHGSQVVAWTSGCLG